MPSPPAVFTIFVLLGSLAPAVSAGDGDHWAFRPVTRPPLPAIDDPDWPRHAIDHFVLARLETAGIEPSPEASSY